MKLPRSEMPGRSRCIRIEATQREYAVGGTPAFRVRVQLLDEAGAVLAEGLQVELDLEEAISAAYSDALQKLPSINPKGNQ